jgi:hypothetical protein
LVEHRRQMGSGDSKPTRIWKTQSDMKIYSKTHQKQKAELVGTCRKNVK